MDAIDTGALVDNGGPRHILTEDKVPLEGGQVPQELTQMLNGAYNEISQKLQSSGKVDVEDIPIHPAVYLCSRADMEKMNELSGSKPLPDHHFVGALYFSIPHAIFLPKEDLDESIATHKLGNLRSSVYEEMIHAMTTIYDETTQILRVGFIEGKPISPASREKILAGRKPKDAFDFYDWSIAYAGEPSVRDFSRDKGAVYREDETYTENTTHLAKYLMIEDPTTTIGTAQFIDRSKDASIRITSSATCGQYQSEYAKRTGGRDISADLLTELFLGDVNLIDKIADTYYKLPQSPLTIARSAFRYITNATDRLAVQLSTAIRELKNPQAFVFSNP